MKMKTKKMNKKGIATIYIIIFIVLVLLFVGYAMWDRYQKGLKQNLDPKQVKIIKNESVKKQPDIKITSKNSPNKVLTPGVVLTQDKTFICPNGYVEKMFSFISPETKEKVFKNYKIPYPPKNNTYIIDHWIALEVGGSNDIENLWPQPYQDGQKKNKVEKYLYSLICNGTINMSVAQSKIKNWTYTYQECCA